MKLADLSIRCPRCRQSVDVAIAVDPLQIADENYAILAVHAGQVEHRCTEGVVVHVGDRDAPPAIPHPRGTR